MNKLGHTYPLSSFLELLRVVNMKLFLLILCAALITPSWADQVAAASASTASATSAPKATIDPKAAAEAANAKMAGPSEDLTKRPEDPNRRICKNAAPTGTRLGKRTCLTAAQWAEAQRIAKEGTKNAQTSALMINKEGN